jgi:hypothetical protein
MPLFSAFDAQQLVEQQIELQRQDRIKQLTEDTASIFSAIERAAGQGRSRVRIRGLQNESQAKKTYLESLGYTISQDVITWPTQPTGQAGVAADIEPKTINMTVNQEFRVDFLVTGGVSPWSFVQSDGSLPEGVEWGPLVNQTALVLEGTPVKTGVGVVKMTVTDRYGTKTTITLDWSAGA